MAESSFSRLKNERVYRTVYATMSQARSDVARHIEGFYNSRRRHSTLGYRRPNEIHYGYQQPALAALKHPLIPLFETIAATHDMADEWAYTKPHASETGRVAAFATGSSATIIPEATPT